MAATGPVNAFSVDVEDWYQVADFDAVIGRDAWGDYESRIARNTDKVLQLCADAGVRGTFFILAWNVERHPEVVRRIADAGHEIASHGYGHRLIYTQTPEEFRQDIRRAKALLEDVGGTPVLGYRAPSFSITSQSMWALDELLEAGYRYDSSVFPVKDTLYGLPDASRFPFVIRERDGRALVEFPITTTRAMGRNFPLGGGGYLRLLPYRYLWWGMRRVNRDERQASVVYIHPWEVDPDHPRVKTAGRRGFSTHYVGLSGTERKLQQLFRDFRFAPMRDVLGLAA